jgi:hypothetical protein
MTEATITAPEREVDETGWPVGVIPPPTNLLYDDGDKLESPWHAQSGFLLKAGYVAVRGGLMTDFYVGVNMFVYYSSRQARTLAYRGPDVYFVKDVDGTKPRLYWAIWEEEGRYPNVIVELLSDSTERKDLGSKKQLYERTFQTPEYFCIASEVSRLLGWQLVNRTYVSIEPDERGWLWSEELNLWLGSWHGVFAGEEHTWPRFYHPDGTLVLLPEEAERQRAESAAAEAAAERQRAESAAAEAAAERQRADEMAARLAALETELRRLRGDA